MSENQVRTMARENSGTAPKLRTYGRLRGYTLQKATRPNYLTGEGGATLDLASEHMDLASHTSGYYVAGYGQVHQFPLRSDVLPYIAAIKDAYTASNGSGLVGTWVHADMVFAQRTEHFECRTVAFLVARKLGQMEVFDIAAGKSIPVDPPVLRIKL